jgi:hypothetical protein
MISQEQQIRPGDIELSDFWQIGRKVIDAIADYQADLFRHNILPNVTPEEVAVSFIDELAEEGESLGASAFPFHFNIYNKSATCF